MAPPVVHLHIGAPKTGTTYVQDVLWANRETLRADGVLLPGRQRYARVHATRDMLRWAPSEGAELPQSWRQLADGVNRWNGRSAVLSQEFLCRMTPEQVAGIVQSFPQSDVRVVLTVRDVARLVPAQWQTLMRSRSTWKLAKFADAVAGVSEEPRDREMAEHFWDRHDSRPILERWAAIVGPDQVQVVTVPASSADPDELWRRFCQACGLDPASTRPGEKSHESLGAVSAELMRRLNAHPTIKKMPVSAYQKSVNGALTRRVLGHRRSLEPGLALPEEHLEWAEREAARLIADIEAVGVEVIGDLEDLRPRPSKHDPVFPDELPAEMLLEAAIDGLAGLAAEHVTLTAKVQQARKKRQRPLAGGGAEGTTTARLQAAYRRRRPRH